MSTAAFLTRVGKEVNVATAVATLYCTRTQRKNNHQQAHDVIACSG
ncbi:hypothetical protein [Paraburkholderia sp. BL6665CI2N2]|nr:hypothetical protein [Paraburkholderia sp. BL6665CI2N2]